MKHTFLFILISLVLLGCKKEEIGNAHIEGYVINRATGDPIQDVEVSLYESGWSSSVTISIKTTDSMGYFLFDGNYQDYRQTLYIDLLNIHYNYQTKALVNGEVKFVNLWGIQPDGHSSEPQTFNIGLYPITSFAIVLNNIHPASPDDIINLSIQNMNNGIPTFEYIGYTQNEIISGETGTGNELILNYDVTSNGIVTSYHKILECTPGDMTIFEINY